MTIDEALNVLKQYIDYNNPDVPDFYTMEEACEVVIEALEQKPCTDAISRQAVLDHIYGVNGLEGLELSNVFEKHYADFIKSLPPVKPRYTDAEIQKMQDLEFAEIQKAYEIGKAEGSEENPNKWIPVSERLPEEKINPITQDYYEYQCTFRSGDIYDVRSYKFGKGHWWLGCGVMDEYVTAWMPLPEPYKASPTRAERSNKE